MHTAIPSSGANAVGIGLAARPALPSCRGPHDLPDAPLKRELAFMADQTGSRSGDWWHLILDPSEPGFWVEHSWQHISPVTGETSDAGVARFGINDFLAL